MSENHSYASVLQRWDRIGGEDGFVLPVGIVTLLLGDVEGSTKAWEAHGDEMPARIAALDTLVTEVVVGHNGVRPVEQGEGDSFVAAFAKASDAVACALDLQGRMATGGNVATEGPIELRYRIGVHAGEVALRGEGNYSGSFINRTARLRDIGHGGQVLLSRVAADLVADALPAGAALLDLGEHRLRDLTRPEHVFQLTHPGLRADFPPLRSLEALPHNLPVQLTSFVGRQRELADLGGLIPDSRLVTLTGSGGCGKTRLALEVAADLIDAFPHGTWFCDLSALNEPGHVPGAVARALGLREQADGTDRTSQLTNHLAGHTALVVLDNCEHLIVACADLVDELLRHCPHLTVLATSREPLGVSGEVSWRVPSLAAPERVAAGSRTSIDSLDTFDAVRLFIDRARQARPNFAVTADNAPAIADICARLDGIPLAIELAAARVRVLGADRIAAGLNDRFRLLGGGARTAMPRQQTLQASVAWSFDLLGDDERTVLRRLAVFAGGFDLDAAEHVVAGNGIDRYDVLELLTRLVDRSLVQVDDTGGAMRYRLLETMRQFAGEQLVASGEAAAVRTRHLEWYDHVIDQRVTRAFASGKSSADTGVAVDVENIRDALAWALDSPDQAEVGLHLVGRLWPHWIVRGSYAEGRQWTEDLLALAPDAAPDTRGEALVTLSWMADFQNDFATSITCAHEAAAIARATGNKRLLAQALEKIGWPLGLYDYDGARSLLVEGIELARAVGDARTAGMCLLFLAFHEGMHGELAASLAHFDESIAERKLAPGTIERAHVNAGTALVLHWQGDVGRSAALLAEAVPVFEKVGDPYWKVLGNVYIAMVAASAGDVERARRAIDTALGSGGGVSLPAVVLAQAVDAFVRLIERREEEVEARVDALLPGLAVYGPSVGRGIEAWVSAVAAVAQLVTGDVEGAAAAAGEALTAAREAHNAAYTPVAMVGVCTVLIATDDVAAEQCAHDALSMCASSGAMASAPPLLELLAKVARQQGSLLEAARVLAAASAARTQHGTRPTPPWGVDVDLEVAELRKAMDDAELDAAWKDGAALSLDDAIAYAGRGRGERKRPASGWGSLTPTERQVVDLVAEGLSNPQIAQRLFMSPRTVASHLTHVFTKLGLRSRAELTAAVLRKR